MADTPNSAVPSIDLEIRVTVGTGTGGQVLDYVLNSPSQAVPFHHKTIRGVELLRPPEPFHRQLLEKIEKLGQGVEGDDEAFLEELGHGLYRQLFSAEMRHAYRQFRGRVETVLITSDEPWIPWELIKPFDDAEPDVIDDDFLCMQFQLTRWLAGEAQPAPVIRVGRIAHVEAVQPPEAPALSAAARERDALAELARRPSGVEAITLSEPQRSELLRLIEDGDADLIHFTGHGDAGAEHSDDDRLLLANWQDLRAGSLDGRLILALKQRRPLVFLNACRTGEQSWVLTRLGGWAEAWVRRCHCGAFLGPQWTVDDTLAADFARTLYQALGEGETLGIAAQRARKQVAALRPGDPTGLAYAVYGHPNARVVFGDQPLSAAAARLFREHQAHEQRQPAPRQATRTPSPLESTSSSATSLRAVRRRPLVTGAVAAAVIAILLVAGYFLLGPAIDGMGKTPDSTTPSAPGAGGNVGAIPAEDVGEEEGEGEEQGPEDVGEEDGEGERKGEEQGACRPGEEIVHDGFAFVRICGGTFLMGSAYDDPLAEKNEHPPHEVTLSEFWIGKYEVTNELYRRFRPDHSGHPDRAIVNVNWYEAREFCENFGFDLPTEAQWEYAARAGTQTPWSFGDDPSELYRYAWYNYDMGPVLVANPVGKKEPNPWGLHDMHGNVHEWVLDFHGPYPHQPQTDPKGPPEDLFRVLRGGSRFNGSKDVRSAKRLQHPPKGRNPDFGFRCVREPSPRP